MPHVVAHHTHVNLANVRIGPNRIVSSLFIDNVDYITFKTAGIIEIVRESETYQFEFHDINVINVVLNPTATIFNITGNA